jgi:putative transposase
MEKTELIKRYGDLSERALQIALARHAAVTWMEARVALGYAKEQCYREASQMEWNGRRFGESTLERYWTYYRQEGFEALLPTGRRDKGKVRVLSDDFLKVLEQRRKAYPGGSIKELLRALEKEGYFPQGLWKSAPSVYRYLRQKGLDSKSMKQWKELGSGPTKSFEMTHVNELWMTDVMHGPMIGKTSTRLIAMIDDVSRLCVYGQYREFEKEEDFWIIFREAMNRRGVPQKVYTDRGKIFTSNRTKLACARLGIKLWHAKAYAAWSKGKIERFFRTIQDQFQSRLEQDPAKDLEELNRRFWHWLESEYHSREHGGIKQSPRDRFMKEEGMIRILDPAILSACFQEYEKRRVRADATLYWRGECWEVPIYLRGQYVEIRSDPLKKEQAPELWHEGVLVGKIKKVDRQINGRTFGMGEKS